MDEWMIFLWKSTFFVQWKISGIQFHLIVLPAVWILECVLFLYLAISAMFCLSVLQLQCLVQLCPCDALEVCVMTDDVTHMARQTAPLFHPRNFAL